MLLPFYKLFRSAIVLVTLLIVLNSLTSALSFVYLSTAKWFTQLLVAPLMAQAAPTSTPVLRGTTLAATPVLRGTATPVLRGTAIEVEPAATPLPPTATPTNLRRAGYAVDTFSGDIYVINRSASSEQLSGIVLTLRNAQKGADQLLLTLAFENDTDDAIRFSFISAVDQNRLQLVDSNGRIYKPLQINPSWAKIQPEGGFVPGGANVGTVAFPVPSGSGPYQLGGIFDYPPIRFSLISPTVITPSPQVPNGHYQVGQMLFSNDMVLEPLRLQVKSVTITTDTFIVALDVVNTNYLSYGLQRGPTGMDATLLDAQQRQYGPLATSPSFATGITPTDGIYPNEHYSGTITFPRPADLEQAQFIFTRYSPLSLQFNGSGLQSSELTSNQAGTIPPTPTPQPETARYNEINALLEQLAVALIQEDRKTFAQGFVPSLQSTIVERFGHLAQMPIESLNFIFAPGQSLDTTTPDRIAEFTVQLRYTLAGIATENYFVQDFAVTFTRSQEESSFSRWQIETIVPQATVPFWWTGEVITHETEHFLIFTRFDTSNAITTLSTEVEAAYDTVQAKGLHLEGRYVAYVTDPEESFVDYTGATNPNVLGVALSRYQISLKAIYVIGRAFYINGTNFVNTEQLDQRQSTITHELVHLALVEEARPFTPPWLTEGLAVYYADQKTAADYDPQYNGELFSTLDLASLTRLTSLGVHDPASETTSYRYLYSGAVIAYLVQQYGEEEVLAFYRSYAAVPAAEIQDRLPLFSSQPSQDRVFLVMSVEVTEKALETHFGLTLEELDRVTKEWLRNQVE